jgi:hypothetical protein
MWRIATDYFMVSGPIQPVHEPDPVHHLARLQWGRLFARRPRQHDPANAAWTRLEIIALDDGSTDGNPCDILHQYASRLPLIDRAHRAHWQLGDQHQSRPAPLARGRYACFLHQDDLWLDGRLAWFLDTVRREPDCPCCSARRSISSRRITARWAAGPRPLRSDSERKLTAAEWFCPAAGAELSWPSRPPCFGAI